MVRRRPARAVPRARRLRSLVACADGASRGGRALARARRRCGLEDPALGRQRHHRAVDRNAARAHDGRTASSRRSRTPMRRWLSCRRTASGSRPRSSAEALRRPCLASDQAVATLSTTVERGRATGSVEEVFLAHALLALLAAREGAWGEAGRHARAAEALVDESGLGAYSTSAIVHARGSTCRLHEARPDDVRACAGTCPPPAAHARPRHSLARRRSRRRAHAHPSRTRRGSHRPHDAPRDRAGAGAPPRHGRLSPRTHESCATASRRPPGRAARGR